MTGSSLNEASAVATRVMDLSDESGLEIKVRSAEGIEQ